MSASDSNELFTIIPSPTTGILRTAIEPEACAETDGRPGTFERAWDDSQGASSHAPKAPRSLTRLTVWMALTVGLQRVLWSSCLKGRALSEAVEQGAARVESRAIGEVSEDQVRKAIRTQNATLPFWTALALIGDFLIEPLSLAV